MNFTDLNFLWFFGVVVVLYYLAPTHWLQRAILIIASLFFYAHETPKLVILLLISCALTVSTSYVVLHSTSARRRKSAAVVGVVLNLAILGFFKYKFLFIGSADAAGANADTGLVRALLLLPLPIGISFYTFHGISLLIDSYRRKDAFFQNYRATLARHAADSLLYLVFFPQLIAGPIVKAKDFFPQYGKKTLADIRWQFAVKSLVCGYFLKMFVADNLQEATFFMQAPYFTGLSSATLLGLLIGYSLQIFADFGGYSLIAIGLAALLGYRLPDNFNFPYISESFSEFWRRWHISLSSWLRDYLYIPLGGSRHGPLRTYFNLIVVMLLGGLWHGAAWNFAVWGLWHGVALALERPFQQTRFMQSRRSWVVMLRIAIVFSVVSLGWLLFRLPNFSDALSYLAAIGNNRSLPTKYAVLVPIAVFGMPVLAYHAIYRQRPLIAARMKPFIYALMLFFTVLNAGRSTAFVYFQF